MLPDQVSVASSVRSSPISGCGAPSARSLPSEKGEVLLRGGRHSTISFDPSSVKALLVKCPFVQWQPDDLTIHTNKWFLGAGFLGAPPISLTLGTPRFIAEGDIVTQEQKLVKKIQEKAPPISTRTLIKR